MQDPKNTPLEQGVSLWRKDQNACANVPHTRVHHSPTGFEWGYGGSGPAELAYNILLAYFDARVAQRHYQDFKWKFITPLPENGGFIPKTDIVKWIEEQQQNSFTFTNDSFPWDKQEQELER